MSRLVLLFLLSTLLSPAFAADIRGRVTGADGKPVSLANVVALAAADTSYICGTTTDTLGHFALTVETERTLLRVTCVGYADTLLLATADNMEICLRATARLVGEVTVTGHRPQYKMGAEGLTTNVEGTLLAKAGSAEDVLKRVPSVSKNGDAWTVFGRGGAVIYLNGHKLQDLSELDNMKSTDLRDIEVIRNPGAKYAASVAAVIRIRTVRRRGEGLSVDARSSDTRSSDNHTTQQVNANYRHNSLNVFALYKFSDARSRQDADMGQTARTDTLWEQIMFDSERGHYQNHTVKGGFSYDLRGDHSIGAYYQARLTGHQTFHTTFDGRVTANGQPYDDISTAMRAWFDNKPIHRANAYYTGHVGKTTIDLNSDVYFSDATTFQASDEHSAAHDSRLLVTENRAKNSMAAAKLSLSSPLLGGKLDYGAEYIHTTSENINRVNREDILPSSASKIRETTAAPYIEYIHETPLGQLRAGLRYEFVRFKYFDDGEYVADQSRTFRNFFPSVSLATAIGKTQWQIAYSAKTRRPSYSQLRNNVSYANRFLRQTGNSKLTNQTDHTVSLTGLWRTFQLTMDYKDARDAIIYDIRQDTRDEAVSVIGFRNEPSIKTFSAQLVAFPRFGFWQPQWAAGIIKQWLTIETDGQRLRLNKPICYVKLGNSLSLPWNITGNVDFTYQSTGCSENIRTTRERAVLDVSLSRSFLKNKALTVYLYGDDLLYRALEGRAICGAATEITQDARHDTRQFTVTLRYNFNTTRSKYRGTGAGNSAVNRM